MHAATEVGHAQGDIEQICIAPIGEGSSPKYYLTVRLDSLCRGSFLGSLSSLSLVVDEAKSSRRI